jgi:hypothetical protein
MPSLVDSGRITDEYSVWTSACASQVCYWCHGRRRGQNTGAELAAPTANPRRSLLRTQFERAALEEQQIGASALRKQAKRLGRRKQRAASYQHAHNTLLLFCGSEMEWGEIRGLPIFRGSGLVRTHVNLRRDLQSIDTCIHL